MPRGCITLADLRDRGVERLVLACARCDRRGVYGVARLIEVHGVDMGLPDLRAVLTAGCAGRQGSSSTATWGRAIERAG